MKSNFWILFTFFLIACEKGEIPIKPHATGDEITNSVEMGEFYGTQLFFSLDQNEVISSNQKTDWDLAFESIDTGWHVRLNTSKGMAVSKKSGIFSSVTDTLGANWSWDAHSGNPDSTAIGNWLNYSGIYLIDRGYNELGSHQGFAKIEIIAVSSVDYQINFGNLTDLTPTSKSISKNSSACFSYFSFTSGETVSIAPPKTEWDILFTQYTHVFEGPTPYLVTGVLLNPHNTEACLIDYIDYSEINFDLAESFTYSTNANVIGYNWKYFDFDEGIYLVDPTQVFVIKTQNDFYYKFHFIDFYNESGVKGYPKFEFSKL